MKHKTSSPCRMPKGDKKNTQKDKFQKRPEFPLVYKVLRAQAGAQQPKSGPAGTGPTKIENFKKINISSARFNETKTLSSLPDAKGGQEKHSKRQISKKTIISPCF